MRQNLFPEPLTILEETPPLETTRAMALTVCRLIKHKHFGTIASSEKHTARLRPTLNADPYPKNIRLIGSVDDPELSEMVKTRIATQIQGKVRKDAVLCSELLLGASADYFRPLDPSRAGYWDEPRMHDFAHAVQQWLLQHYAQNCIRAELHLDESTPHIHAYIVPINETTRKLSHKQLFGGSRDSLSQLQASFALAVEHLGIQRGIKGSQATHTQIKKYYAAVNAEPLTLELERLAPHPLETAPEFYQRIKEDPTLASINHQLADRWRLIQHVQHLQQWATLREKENNDLKQQIQHLKALRERENNSLKQQMQHLEAENSHLKQQALQWQDLPLWEVANHLGLHRDEQGQWRGQGQQIALDEWQQQGVSAIELVMQVQGSRFPQASAWLHRQFGEAGMLRAVRYGVERQAQALIRQPASQKPKASQSLELD